MKVDSKTRFVTNAIKCIHTLESLSHKNDLSYINVAVFFTPSCNKLSLLFT